MGWCVKTADRSSTLAPSLRGKRAAKATSRGVALALTSKAARFRSFVVVLLALLAAPSEPQQSGSPGWSGSSQVMNQHRQSHGLAPLRVDRTWCAPPAAVGRWPRRGTSLTARSPAHGRLRRPRAQVGENLGGAPARTDRAGDVRGWLKSPVHRENLLRPAIGASASARRSARTRASPAPDGHGDFAGDRRGELEDEEGRREAPLLFLVSASARGARRASRGALLALARPTRVSMSSPAGPARAD